MFNTDAQREVLTTSTPEVLEELSESSRTCIQRLLAHFSHHKEWELSLSGQPLSKLAAVLVLLYEDNGELRVLLTTRSKSLRTHAGQTALPGGKVEPEEDESFVSTALREANEEVNLPLNSPHIHILGLLNPSISLHRLIVVPVIALLTQPDLLKGLVASEKEVARIFSHPLEAILEPSLAQKEDLVPIGSEDWPYPNDYYNTSDSVIPMLGNTIYRMHRFRTSASPIKGLTADFVIKTAEIAYNRQTDYDRYAPDQLTSFTDILQVVDVLQPNGVVDNTSATLE